MDRFISSVGVYCGSSPGDDPEYLVAALEFGRILAEREVRLVYGGGSVGLMGAVADGALGAGGEVLGVITRALEAKGVAHPGLSALEVSEGMHARKKRMADESDAFVLLPGGFGSFEEFFEMVTWTQLDLQRKPCGVLDVNGFFAPLREFLDSATAHRFIRQEHRNNVLFAEEPTGLLDALGEWEPVIIDKWIDRA